MTHHLGIIGWLAGIVAGWVGIALHHGYQRGRFGSCRICLRYDVDHAVITFLWMLWPVTFPLGAVLLGAERAGRAIIAAGVRRGVRARDRQAAIDDAHQEVDELLGGDR